MADLVPVPAAPSAAAAGLDKARGLLGQPGVRRMLPWFAGLGGLGLAALTWAMVVPAPQRMLYSTLSDGERAEVAAALDTAGIAYQIDGATGAVTVGEDDLYRARMTVASQGALALPETGVELIDSLPMGASRTLEGDRLRAAQERELQLTIMEIDGVEAVRVHLAKADRSVFVRDTSDPTASVMLRLKGGQQLTAAQVTAIANLVAASVSGLTPDKVRIVDQNGRLLNDPANPDMDTLDLQARTEEKLREQLAALLTPMVGAGRFSTEVQVELDMNEQTSAAKPPAKPPAPNSPPPGFRGQPPTPRRSTRPRRNAPPQAPSQAQGQPRTVPAMPAACMNWGARFPSPPAAPGRSAG